MTILFDRKVFYAKAREVPFGNRLTQQQVDGTDAILDYWEAKHADKDVRWLAYILATSFHETGSRMVAVREGFAGSDASARKVVAHRKYGVADPETGFVYYGRGHVQLTWRTNYKRVGERLGVDLDKNPDLALDPAISVQVLVEGMIEGLYTPSRDLPRYFNASINDPIGARFIVNVQDKAQVIAAYHAAFLQALKVAAVVHATPAATATPAQEAAAKPDGAKLHKDPVTIGTLIGGAGGVAGVATAAGPLLSNINNPWAFGAFALMVVAVCVGGYLAISGRLELRRKAGA